MTESPPTNQSANQPTNHTAHHGLPNKSPHTYQNQLMRFLWGIVQATLFRFSPRPMLRWRIFLLKLFGAKVTYKSRVYPRAKIWGPWNLVMGDYATLADDVDCYCVDTITIGPNTTISQYTYLCGATHDFEDIRHTLIPLPITIGTRVWIAADCFISPGVNIPDGVVVGARAGVFSNLEPWTVCAGTPAKKLRDRNHPLNPKLNPKFQDNPSTQPDPEQDPQA